MELILNHLWQSTVFGGLAWLLTLALKRNRAQTRYWLWFAASMKFFVPFAMLVAAGSQVSWRVATPLSVPTAVEEVVRPFGAAAPLVAVRETVPVRTNPIPELLLLVWAAGFVSIGIKWGHRWTRMNIDAGKARAIEMGLPVPVRTSAVLREPGVFGALRPILLLPEGLTERLTAEQLEAILAHELCHVLRRDNLATAMHMVVEAVFWFHPLVWWIGARLMEERERACDEEVLRSGNDAQTYAEGILKVCEFYLKSPLECVAGVSGANLNRRIEEIMANRIVFKLNAGRKLLLAGAGVLALAGPIAVGLMNAPPLRAQARSETPSAFEVTSVKPHQPGSPFASPQFLPGGRFRSGTMLVWVIGLAYDVPFTPAAGRLSGGPIWIRTLDGVYDIEATSNEGVVPGGLSAKAREVRMRPMLQRLLADRFKLGIHRETREVPVYALVVAKGGLRLQKADIEERNCPGPSADGSVSCHAFVQGPGKLRARAVSMPDLAGLLTNFSDRPVLDKTGIDGLFAVDTKNWQPLQPGAPPPPPEAKLEDGADLAGVPAAFAAFERFGLKLESQKGVVETVVIDHIEKPTEN